MDAPLDIIFDKDNFLSVFNQDIVATKKEILIASPFARQKHTHHMIQHLKTAIGEHIFPFSTTIPAIRQVLGCNLFLYTYPPLATFPSREN
jgi:hypothetical protein